MDGTATDEVLVTEVTEEGNLTGWTAGPALPQPRTGAAVGMYTGVPFVMGGLDEAGQPTATVYKGVVEEGLLTDWVLADGENRTDELTLPQPLSGASVVPGTSGFMLLGGRDANGQPTNGVHVAWVDEVSGGDRLLAWEPLDPNLALPEPRTGAVAAAIADFIYVIGGEGPDGPTDTVFRLEVNGREPATNEAGDLDGWAVAPEDLALPEPRAGATMFSANGAVHVIGGYGAEGVPQESMLWAVPDTGTGDYDSWQRLEQTDLPIGTAAAPVVGVGSHAFIFGGETPDGTTDGSLRSAISPRPPFFQLGIAGATIPGLAIKGEVGQQLGYLIAMGVGMTNFIILIIIGVAFSRPESSKRVLSRLSGGRLPMPEEERYRS